MVQPQPNPVTLNSMTSVPTSPAASPAVSTPHMAPSIAHLIGGVGGPHVGAVSPGAMAAASQTHNTAMPTLTNASAASNMDGKHSTAIGSPTTRAAMSAAIGGGCVLSGSSTATDRRRTRSDADTRDLKSESAGPRTAVLRPITDEVRNVVTKEGFADDYIEYLQRQKEDQDKSSWKSTFLIVAGIVMVLAGIALCVFAGAGIPLIYAGAMSLSAATALSAGIGAAGIAIGLGMTAGGKIARGTRAADAQEAVDNMQDREKFAKLKDKAFQDAIPEITQKYRDIGGDQPAKKKIADLKFDPKFQEIFKAKNDAHTKIVKAQHDYQTAVDAGHRAEAQEHAKEIAMYAEVELETRNKEIDHLSEWYNHTPIGKPGEQSKENASFALSCQKFKDNVLRKTENEPLPSVKVLSDDHREAVKQIWSDYALARPPILNQPRPNFALGGDFRARYNYEKAWKKAEESEKILHEKARAGIPIDTSIHEYSENYRKAKVEADTAARDYDKIAKKKEPIDAKEREAALANIRKLRETLNKQQDSLRSQDLYLGGVYNYYPRSDVLKQRADDFRRKNEALQKLESQLTAAPTAAAAIPPLAPMPEGIFFPVTAPPPPEPKNLEELQIEEIRLKKQIEGDEDTLKKMESMSKALSTADLKESDEKQRVLSDIAARQSKILELQRNITQSKTRLTELQASIKEKEVQAVREKEDKDTPSVSPEAVKEWEAAQAKEKEAEEKLRELQELDLKYRKQQAQNPNSGVIAESTAVKELRERVEALRAEARIGKSRAKQMEKQAKEKEDKDRPTSPDALRAWDAAQAKLTEARKKERLVNAFDAAEQHKLRARPSSAAASAAELTKEEEANEKMRTDVTKLRADAEALKVQAKQLEQQAKQKDVKDAEQQAKKIDSLGVGVDVNKLD